MLFNSKNTDGQESLTALVFKITAIIAWIKLLISGVTFGGFSAGTFGGGDFALVLSAAGGIYTARRATEKQKPLEEKSE